jgi:hypothetical protein
MQKHEVKLKNRLGRRRLARRLLRLWRADAQPPASSIDLEAAPVNIYGNSWREETRVALLNAERKKAETLMEWQRRRFDYV